MKPKSLTEEEWKRIGKHYRFLNLNRWNMLDGLKKVNVLNEVGIDIVRGPIFGNNYGGKYPDNIYKFGKCRKRKLNMDAIHDIVLNEEKEVGGIITRDEAKILFTGTNNRIDLDLEKSTANMQNIILFHTHPKDETVEHDPPSILDIISFLSFNIKSMANLVLNREKADIGKIMKIQCSLVFTQDEIYSYYFSHELVINIVDYLLKVYRENEGMFIDRVEKILEEIEINYSFYLRDFNKVMTNFDVIQYFKKLEFLGFIIHRSSYNNLTFYEYF